MQHGRGLGGWVGLGVGGTLLPFLAGHAATFRYNSAASAQRCHTTAGDPESQAHRSQMKCSPGSIETSTGGNGKSTPNMDI